MKTFTLFKSKKLQTLFVVLFWITIWEIVAYLVNQELLLPSPLQTLKAFFMLAQGGVFWKSVASSILRVLLGFGISLVLGCVLGTLSGLFPIIYTFLLPLMVVVKSTPVMSIIIIALVWCKSSNVPIFVALLMCFPIIWTNTVEGIRQTDYKLLEMATIFGVKISSKVKSIYIPSIKPYLIAGIKNTLGLSWKVTVAAEVLSSPRYSIGYHLLSSKIYLESASLFAWTAVIVGLSFLFEYAIQFLIRRWG